MTGVGVVLAQRLEQLAEPNAVIVQGAVSETVPTRLPFNFKSLGEHRLKGFEQPIRAFSVSVEADRSIPDPESVGGDPTPTSVIATAVAPILAENPSVAVLPFNNVSGDPSQEYFGESLSESLISSLSKASGLTVIASQSSFSYKDRAASVQEIATELDVTYVLQGSVHQLGNRIRVNAQLVEGGSAKHVWAERYDRTVDDLFELQDDLVFNILTACQVALVEGEHARMMVAGESKVNLEAVELYWQAMTAFRRFNKADNHAARTLLERCIEIGGETPSRLTMLGYTHLMDARTAWSDDREASLQMAYEFAQNVESRGASGFAKGLLANIAQLRGRYDEAVKLASEAVVLEPSSANEHYVLGIMSNYAGEPERAADALNKAMRLCPLYPIGYLYQRGLSQYLLGEHALARSIFVACMERNPQSASPVVWLAIIDAETDKLAQAGGWIEHALELMPQMSVKRWIATELFKNRDIVERMATALRKAGMPEG